MGHHPRDVLCEQRVGTARTSPRRAATAGQLFRVNSGVWVGVGVRVRVMGRGRGGGRGRAASADLELDREIKCTSPISPYISRDLELGRELECGGAPVGVALGLGLGLRAKG